MTTTPVTIGTHRNAPVPSQTALRLDLAARITAAARVELCQRPEDFSLRAVARRAEIDPGELHRLVESREQLITNVMFEIAFDAQEAVRPAVAATTGDGCRSQLLALLHAFRRWALANPREFAVLLGPPRHHSVDRAGGVRAMRWLYGPALQICREGVDAGEIDLDAVRHDYPEDLVHPGFRDLTGDVDARLVALFLGLATGLYGYLMLESTGRMAVVFGDLDRAFDAHAQSLLDGAGVR